MSRYSLASVSHLCGIVFSCSLGDYYHKQVIHCLPRACPLGTALAQYLQPGDSAWKSVLDEFILKSTRGGKLQYPEGRPIVAMGLTVAQKRAILKRMPTKAVYWKECLLAFWDLKLDRQVVGWEGIDGESPWHGPRTECVRKGVSYHVYNIIRTH